MIVLIKIIKIIVYFPFFIIEIFLYKLFKKKNSEKAYQELIKLFIIFGRKPNILISNFLKSKKINFFKNKFEYSVFDKETVLKKLKSEGLYIKEGFLTEGVRSNILKYLLNTKGIYYKENLSSNCYELVNLKEPKYNIFRYHTDDLVNCEEIQDLMVNNEILEIAQEYLNGLPKLDLVESWWTFPSEQVDMHNAQMWHFDIDRTRWLKIFIFLDDCFENNGPHSFIKKTHNKIPFNIRKKGYVRINDEDINNNINITDIKKVTAKKGSILFEDTMGLHRGENVKEKNRIVLQLQYSTCFFGNIEKKIAMPKNMSKKFEIAIRNYPNIFENFHQNI